ncbi:uncharacterized protein EI90DRAFT_3121889 [Cantharellus anzutake]|uniref:uncharacterized protein n=1 Tax=Cantharellus anzutake TaxID=1750568 RepID=UPI001906959D|nr:uncharacterized protein EI90DRAFT_3121889 [Cantharellus anzutake]KAF8333558.1 hypothetical protein EI90DRAFT_3121889 [Cantharellus anzutake]
MSANLVLRVKRKRNDEPLDALVVDLRRKKQREANAGIFKYLETVQGDEEFLDVEKRRSLETRVASYSTNPNTSSACANHSISSVKLLSGTAKNRVTTPRFTIRKSTVPDVDEFAQTGSSIREISRDAVGFRDAIPHGATLRSSGVAPSSTTGDFRDSVSGFEMEQFNRMVQEYLTGSLNALLCPWRVVTSSEIEDEYVYDLFLLQRQSSTERMDLDSTNVGLVFLQPEDEIEFISSSDDETEPYEDDVDSNAEDNPLNDYPDESGGSDASVDVFGDGDYDSEYDF